MIKTRNPDVVINEIEFASGQEPLNGEDFVSLVRANYTIKDVTLARMLRKQERVLARYLLTIGKKNGPTKKQIINMLTREPEPGDKLAPQNQIRSKIGKFVGGYIVEEFDVDAPRMSIHMESESDLPYTLSVDLHDRSVTLETEYGIESL